MRQTTLITNQVKWWHLDVAKLWRHRQIVGFLVWRDIAVRYKQTYVGILWVILQPVIEMIVFTLVFHRFVGIRSPGLPYPVFVYLGLLPWTYFTSSVSRMMTSIVGEKALMTRIVFPRLYLPLSKALSELADFLAAFSVLFLLMWIYSVPVSLQIFWIVPLFVLTVLVAVGTGLLLAGAHAIYRDIGLIVPYFLRIMMFVTPVIYPIKTVSPQWQWLLRFNPFTGIIEGFRSAIMQTAMPLHLLADSAIATCVLLLLGLFVFQKLEPRFMDEI